MKSFLIIALTFLGVTMFAPQAEAGGRHYRYYNGGHRHYSRAYYHGHHRHYYPRYYSSSYYYPRVRYYGHGYGYPASYCYPGHYYRPGVSFVFRF